MYLVAIVYQIFALIYFNCAAYLPNNVVVINQGSIKGQVYGNGEYTMFTGVPYGLVDEKLPFGKSLPPPRFDGVFEAYNDTIACPQYEYGKIYGTLQCLILNIYVPTTTAKKPVMVWIHGGKLTFGNSNKGIHSPTFLVKHDIILVTVNYRLGPYGFLCLDTPEIPGNQGLKDLVTALRWIKENIEAFGGDIDNITLTGESSGAMVIDLFLYTQPDENLFHRVIIQSGQALTPVLFLDKDLNVPFKIAKELGYESTNLDDVLNFLANENSLDVVRVAEDSQLNRTPCVEKVFDNVESFLTEYPSIMAPDRIKSMPMVVGYNNIEMLFEYATKDETFYENYKISDMIQSNFDFGDELEEAAGLIKNFYYGEMKGEARRMGIINFISDYWFTYPAERAVRHYIEHGAVVYRYMFTYDGGRNFVKVRDNITHWGAAHADELGYMFDMALFEEKPNVRDQLMIDRLTTMWTNFVKYGNPTPQESLLLPLQWPPLSASSQLYLKIDAELTLESNPLHDRMAFWDSFYRLYGSRQRRVGKSNKEGVNNQNCT